ncbi:hypothetical protein SVIO_099380 [Streptomyces violaceusniger]|uniref:ABC transmembrane type-1 domain-containing protein n=1 Tax=Streptomyces violaceusniger TaxID=68280 RepID=A0A4D4LDY1_STRVO|nr:hypothetical protein SVIO_099380 [Streptomyces violaceusniger]
MHIRDLPYPDPGRPDVRSGPRFLFWLGRNQLGGQVKAALWGLVHMAALVSFPLAIGFGVQAVVDRSGSRLAMAGALMVGLTVLTALGDAMLHRAAVTNWITAAARVQQLLSRKAVELGSTLTRKVAAGEVVAVSTGDVEKIGWFVEALSRFTAAAITTVALCVALVFYQPALGVVVAAGVPALALAVLPLLPRAARRADDQREKAGRATELASDTVAGLRVLRGIGGEELFLSRYRDASQEVRAAAVRSARMWALIAAVQVALPGLLLIGVVWYGVSLAREGGSRWASWSPSTARSPFCSSRCGTSRRSPWRTPSPGPPRGALPGCWRCGAPPRAASARPPRHPWPPQHPTGASARKRRRPPHPSAGICTTR